MSHGDLAHTGLYAYAHMHWGLTAPAYTTLPVQAMARIAATEDVEGIRDEEDVGDDQSAAVQDEASDEPGTGSESPEQRENARPKPRARKYVATVHEVHEAFDSVNVLRYSQPCHLQGT